MSSRVRIKDVAAEADVSVTTVSHVLNQTPHTRVNEETRRRVLDVAARLNYRPNRVARSLRTQSSGMIGLLTEEFATTPHAGRIILGAQEAASRNNLTLAIINSALQADAVERRDDVAALLDRQVDGIIYATVFHDVVSPPAELRTVPSVLIGARDRTRRVSSVTPDERQGARDAVRSLVALGHRRIGFVANTTDVPATRGRRLGYLDALEEAGIEADPDLVAEGEAEAGGGFEAATALLDRPGERPTAIFCYNDRMAMGVYRAIGDHGLRIPDDISVIGFDDQEPIASGLYPGLTTVSLPHYEMGAWAVDSLVSQRDGDRAAGTHRLPCPLVHRGSVAPVGVSPA
ncbi:LacI family DNA-binding transcriptional regulator [Isoptericola sp. 178]|uniref:LacI family DNA-binding transcriptional regulator n=1 Tax=Isoptericola sp. 178 TaxID=3064651 RepID=UPI0027129E03|nr:LacI family DNA-binding transcriptional regulator [Isoptericola sp. 178]MDO8143796.1 LacI family DNA-binding transcriptional regulator [Isoptericola sp. 178]